MLDRATKISDLLLDILDECRDKRIGNLPFLEGIIAEYLAVVVCAEIEEKIVASIWQRLDEIAPSAIANVIAQTQRSIIQRIPKSDLAKTIGMFGDDCKETFNNSCTEQDVAAYSAVVLARHATAHPGSPKISIKDVQNGIRASNALLKNASDAIRLHSSQ